MLCAVEMRISFSCNIFIVTFHLTLKTLCHKRTFYIVDHEGFPTLESIFIACVTVKSNDLCFFQIRILVRDQQMFIILKLTGWSL